MQRKRWPASRADQLRQHDAWNSFYAAAADKPAPAPSAPPRRERIKRPVDGRPVLASEHQEQAALISWWSNVHRSYALPHFSLFAVPNGGARDAITGARLKDEGVRRGALDLILAKTTKRYAGLFLEMKVGDNKPTDEQEAFIEYLIGAGYCASVHWNAASAIEEIKRYLS